MTPLSGSASPAPIAWKGNVFYDSGAQAISYVLQDTVVGTEERYLIQNQQQTGYQVTAMTGQCSQAVVAPLADLKSPSLFFYFAPNFLVANNFTYIGIDYYRRDLVYYQTWHYRLTNSYGVQIDYFHSADFNVPFRFVIGWSQQLYYNSWNPLIAEFQFSYRNGLSSLSPFESSQVFAIPTSCSGSISQAAPPAKSSPPKKPPVASPWPLQWNGETTFTGNDFGSLLTSLVQIQLAGHFYYDSPNNRECNIWIDVTSGERTKTLIVNGAFHAVTYSTGACVEPPVPIHESLHPNWTLNLPYFDNRWIVRASVHPLGGDFFLGAQHFAWDAFNAGAEHAFQFNQLPTGEPLLFQGPVYDFPPYLQSFSSWSQFTVGLQGLNVTNIYGVPSNCQKIGNAAWNYLISPDFAQRARPTNESVLKELREIGAVFDLNLLRNSYFATLNNLRARYLIQNQF